MTGWISFLPLIVVLVPLAGSAVVSYASRRGNGVPAGLTGFISFLTLTLTWYQFLLVRRTGLLTCSLPGSLGLSLHWRVDFIGACFSVVVAAVWFLSTVFGREYMAHEHSQTRFFATSIFTLGSTLGVFVAGDLFTLFLFFELMTFAAYLLVIHEQDRESMSAGNVYLYMSLVGGLILLAAIFIIQYAAGHTRFEPMIQALVEKGISPWLVMALVIGGFGVKAGIIPLHIWLPRAHPVAPAPASALLSALMIKTGAYGFFRFLYLLLTAPEGSSLLGYQQTFGYLFIWIGAVTMFVGALLGILNNSMKKILAYSSISQMGYILFGLGTGAFLGPDGATALAGAWLHVINHAFFKSFLFLLAGAVVLHTGELDLNKLGGLRQKMPWTFAFFLVAAGAITGVPGLSGYVSKTLIHEAILEAYHIYDWPILLWLERIFVITGGLTAAYITKIWLKTFLGKPRQDWDGVQDISLRHKLVFGFYTLVILAVGNQAQKVVNLLALPAAEALPFDAESVAHLTHVPYWHFNEMSGALVSYVIAGVVLVLLWKFGERIRVPKWLSVEYLFYGPVYRAVVNAIEQGTGDQAAAQTASWLSEIVKIAAAVGLILVVFLLF